MHETRNRTGTIALLAAASLFCGGCATTHHVSVDAVRNAGIAGDVQRASFRLVNANPDLMDDDPMVRATASLVRTALSSKGMFEAPDGVQPELVIDIDCGISGGQRRVDVVAVPVYVERPAAGGDWCGTSLEKFGEQERRIVTVVYEKQLRISAREFPASAADVAAPAREVWSVIATSVDEDPNLGRCAPLLVAAAMDELGTDSSEPRQVSISGRDVRVSFVCAGM